MKRAFLLLISGSLFGFGLCLSQMVDPAKVLGFLDIAGAWDPSLAFVMMGALVVTMIGFTRIFSWPKPLLDGNFATPTRSGIDRPLIVGAIIFGIGWGWVGFCPGPAIASIAYSLPESWVFVASMAGGMFAVRLLLGPQSLQPTPRS